MSFDFFNIQNSGKVAGIATTSLRKLIKSGLPVYKIGQSYFVSLSELEKVIRTTCRVFQK